MSYFIEKTTEYAVQTSEYVVRYVLYVFKNTKKKKTSTCLGRHVLSSDVRLLVSVNDLRVHFKRTVNRPAEGLSEVMSMIENRRKSLPSGHRTIVMPS